MRINDNVATYAAARNFHRADNVVNRSIERLSSGKRINSAGDDAAGLAVSGRLVARVQGLNQANKNLQDGYSMVQTAEGGLETISDSLQRMRTLAIQASNETLTDEDRSLSQQEVGQLISEVDRTAGTVTFNNLELLTGYIDWRELETDPSKINVQDVGLIGSADFGIYKVKLDTAAVAEEQTSVTATGSFLENEALTTGNSTIANATVAGGGYTYSGGNWTADFTGTNIEMMHTVTSNGTNLVEGTDYNYTNGTSGADETQNIINMQVTANSTLAIVNENATDGGANKLNLTHVVTNLNVGDTITVSDALVDATTSARQTVANGGISVSLDTESKANDTAISAGAIAGSTQQIDVTSGNADMQTTAANLNTFNVTALSDSSAQMSGFTAANSGFTGAQVADSVASANTSTTDATGKVTVGQTTGTFTANSLSVGAVTMTDATIQDENVSSDGIVATDGATYDVHEFTISGSNTSATLISNAAGVGVVDSTNNILQNYNAGGAGAIAAGAVGDYYYDSATGVFTVKVAFGANINTSTITYKADYQWTAGNTIENADNTFNLANITTGNGGTLTYAGGETVTYDDAISYQDDEYESITLDNTGAIAGTNFVSTGNNAGATYGVAGDFYNSANDQTQNTLVWNADDVGFATNFSVDYTYGIDYTSAGFTISENLDGTVDVTKTAGNTTSQFLDTVNGDSSQKMSYNYKDMYVDNFQITDPGNVTNAGNWGINLNTVLGTGSADITANSANGDAVGNVDISAVGTEQYVGNLAVDYTYNGSWSISAIDRDGGVLTFNDPSNGIASSINDLVGNSTVQVSYNTFKDNLVGTWYGLQSEAVLSSTQINANGEVDDFTTPYTASNSGSADPGTPSSLKLTEDGTNWLSYGTRAQVDAGTADYTVEGQALRFKTGIVPGNVKAYYTTNSNTNAVTLNAGDTLGNVVGAADSTEYTTANQGIFKGFNQADQISFTVDGRQIDIAVNPSDTVQDLIDRINTTSTDIYTTSGTEPANAYMGSGNNNNAGIWAELVGNQIVISPRDETNNYGYKGSRFDITVNDDQIGPGTFLNFGVSQASVDPTITVTDPDDATFSSTSTNNSNFFNNTLETSGIPGVRVQLKETAAALTESIVELNSYTLQAGADSNQTLGLTMIDMRAGALGISNIDISTVSGAEAAITTLDSAINQVNAHRATLGAVMNRIEHAINANAIQAEQTSEANSRIVDTDFAATITEQTKNQIIQQGALSTLMHAQQSMREGVLDIVGAR